MPISSMITNDVEKFDVLKHLHVDDRVLFEPFPNHEEAQPNNGHDDQGCDEVRAQPIVLLPFIEHNLQSGHAQHEC